MTSPRANTTTDLGASHRTAPAIQMLAVSKLFGRRPALREVSFSLYPGEVVGFVGLNGAGKTTSLRILLGLLAPSSGTALILGAPMRMHAAAGRVGALVDRPAFPAHLDAASSLRMFGLLRGEADHVLGASAARVLDAFGVTNYARKRFADLSSGMRQRVGLAYAFLCEPPVIILDEPTDGLDPEGVAALRVAIKERSAAGGTVLFSSHLLSEVESIADRVIIIHRGSVIADQPEASLRKAGALRLKFADALIAQDARAVLLERGWPLSGVSVAGPTLRVDAADGLAVGQVLSSVGIFALEMVAEHPSLEEAFLGLAASKSQELPE